MDLDNVVTSSDRVETLGARDAVMFETLKNNETLQTCWWVLPKQKLRMFLVNRCDAFDGQLKFFANRKTIEELWKPDKQPISSIPREAIEAVRQKIGIVADQKKATRDITDEIRQEFYIEEIQLINGKLHIYGYKWNWVERSNALKGVESASK